VKNPCVVKAFFRALIVSGSLLLIRGKENSGIELKDMFYFNKKKGGEYRPF
jgi:hypothetical protein